MFNKYSKMGSYWGKKGEKKGAFMDVLADSSDTVAEHGGREQNQITGLISAGSDKQPQAWLKREQ